MYKGNMFEQADNFKAAKNELLRSPQGFLIRNYLKKRKPRYLSKLIDTEKLAEVRKTISEIEVVFLNPNIGIVEDFMDADIEAICPRSSDLQHILPHIASKYIKYRKDQSERKRDEVSARKSTFLWQRRKKD